MDAKERKLMMQMGRAITALQNEVIALKKPITVVQISDVSSFQFELASPHNTMSSEAHNVLGKQLYEELNDLFMRFNVCKFKCDV